MPTPTFCMTIGKEMQSIDGRCDEIENTMQALERERLVLVERKQALEAMRSLYKTSQKQIDEALVIQASTSGIELEAVAVQE